MMPDDTIEKIFCYKNYSVLLTKFGNIFVTGNYDIKEQSHANKKNKENNKENNRKNKGKNKHKDEKKMKGEKKEKEKNKEKDDLNNNNINNSAENKWINLSKDVCYCYYNLYNLPKKKFKY